MKHAQPAGYVSVKQSWIQNTGESSNHHPLIKDAKDNHGGEGMGGMAVEEEAQGKKNRKAKGGRRD